MKSDRDSSFDRLLAEALEARAAGTPEGACLDADTLAAWADDALPRQEREAVEAHAVDCARCQLMLATMIRTPPAPVAAKPLWRRQPLAWLIPLTAAVAAGVLWVVVPGRAPSQQGAGPVSTVAETTSPAAPAGDLPAKLQSDTQPQGRGAAAPSAPGEIKTAPSAPATRPDAKIDESAVAAPRQRDQKESASLDANALSDAGRASKDARVASREGGATSPASPASSAPPAATAAQRTIALAKAAAPGNVVVSSNPAIQWRIIPGGVERSTDGGSSWQPQDTGTSVTLAGGASPSPSVCWLVGADGTVLLSTDGRSWRRLPFPEPTALTSIRATDDKTATVTAADGRTFSTADSGLNWVQSRAN